MFEFHGDKKRYFELNIQNTEQYIIPFIEKAFPVKAGMRVLEIGCGEGGVLKAFINKGCTGVGVELMPERLEEGRKLLPEDLANGNIRFIAKNIYEADIEKDLGGLFDIIVLKDVIEHIHDQAKLIGAMKSFLKPGGTIFFGFPPWQMPFGGHQQMCVNKTLAKLPWYHLLPAPVFKAILTRWSPDAVENLMEVKETGISIERFERIVKKQGYTVANKTLFLLNPIYKWKFGWEAKKQLPVLRSLPYIRNFFTTCAYYLITPKA